MNQYPQSPHGQPPPVYNMYPAHQQGAPPPYPTQQSGYGHQLGMMSQTQMGGQQYSQSHSLYAQAATRAGRQRASTMDQQQGGIPPAIQRVASHLDPNAPIRLQPNPAYYPPPPEWYEDSSTSNSRRRGSRGQHRNRDFIRTLEERTLEEGFIGGQNQWHWGIHDESKSSRPNGSWTAPWLRVKSDFTLQSRYAIPVSILESNNSANQIYHRLEATLSRLVQWVETCWEQVNVSMLPLCNKVDVRSVQEVPHDIDIGMVAYPMMGVPDDWDVDADTCIAWMFTSVV